MHPFLQDRVVVAVERRKSQCPAILEANIPKMRMENQLHPHQISAVRPDLQISQSNRINWTVVDLKAHQARQQDQVQDVQVSILYRAKRLALHKALALEAARPSL